jgi:hypothetical protein
MVRIRPTDEEQARGVFGTESIARGIEAIETDGFVVVEDVVDLDHIQRLRERMLEDLPLILEREDAPFNFTRSNVQQDPPPFAPYLFRDVLFNEYAIALTHAVFGDGLYNAFYSGNTALPNTAQRQPVHADMGHLWPNMKHATPAYALVVNIPVVDMHPGNGSTEIWPGTHLDTSVSLQQGDIKVSAEKLAAQREIASPIQPEVRAGSILIRDMRLWHAGMPNPSDDPRPMIAMIHWVGWWPHGEEMTFPAESRDFFEHPILKTRAKYVHGPIDYLRHGEAYDLDPARS